LNHLDLEITRSFCKPGFGLVGRSLTAEKLRICYVMTGDQMERNKSPAQTLIEAAQQEQTEENRFPVWLAQETHDAGAVKLPAADNASRP